MPVSMKKDSKEEKLKSCVANFFKRDSAADKNISRNVVSTKCRESFFSRGNDDKRLSPSAARTTIRRRRRRHDDDDTTVVDAMSPIVFAVTADNGTVGAATKSRPEQSSERQLARRNYSPGIADLIADLTGEPSRNQETRSLVSRRGHRSKLLINKYCKNLNPEGP